MDEQKSPREIAEQLIKALREGRAGASTGPDGEVVAGRPNWEEATKDQRFSEKMKTHGWPMGLAKSTWWKRDGLVAAERADRLVCPPAERERRDAAREALAWAVDAERFLGSFSNTVEPRGGMIRLQPIHIDDIAEHIELWLRERGYEIRPIEPGTATVCEDPRETA